MHILNLSNLFQTPVQPSEVAASDGPPVARHLSRTLDKAALHV